MEAIGLEVINTYNRQNKQSRALVENDKGSFLGELKKMFCTVEFGEVQRSYMADQAWLKKNPYELRSLHLVDEDEDEEQLSVLYKEYRKILMRLYRMKRELKEG